VPRLWEDSIGEHRRAVRAAILDATAGLVVEEGLRAVTMSQVAERAGIGRATLYRYFGDVDAILIAWHERQLELHLAELATLRAGPGSAGERLAAVLALFASIQHEHRGSAGAEVLHRGSHVARAHEHVEDLVRDLVAEAARAGDLRGDVAPTELASYCLAALRAAAGLASPAAVQRLVGLTLDGLRPVGAEPAP
jgi:AcrR family transcriptional regulator